MTMAYTKLDAGITDSTIWQAPDATRLVWITMLAMADQNGYVGASMPGLAGRARVALDACITAIETLESPDEWSRTKEHEGRRIAPADGGWVLLNHAKYRAMQSADDRRERSRVAMAELRAKRKQVQTPVNGERTLTKLTLHESKLSQAEAEAEALKTHTSADASLFAEFWAKWPSNPRKQAKATCAKLWKAKQLDEQAAAILAHVGAMVGSPDWTKDGGAFVCAPLVYLRQARWDGADIPAPPEKIEMDRNAVYERQLAASIASMRK